MTGKQRAYLRGLANTIDAKYQIGKNGVDENTIKMIDEALEANELIKIKFWKMLCLMYVKLAVKYVKKQEHNLYSV